MISVEKKLFGMYQNEEILKYSIRNENGFCVNVLNFGGTITEILVRDRKGNLKNVVLGYKNFEDYAGNGSYAGMIVGRTSGRIENAEFILDNERYSLFKNDGENSLHGGKDGLSSRIFKAMQLPDGVELLYRSPHLEEGYPGEVEFRIRYLVSEKNELTLEYEAYSDRDTYINLTNHSYFNLSGNMDENGDGQILKIKAEKICELREGLIPTGEKKGVENTVFDFRKGLKIKDGIEKGQSEDNSQFQITRAYDHPFVLESAEPDEPQITLFSEYSGIEMKVFTTERTAVIYTGNFLDEVKAFDSVTDKKKIGKNSRYAGVAIETQDYPNGINEKKFENRILRKGEKLVSRTVFKFSYN